MADVAAQLAAMAKRLDALESQNAQLRTENTHLRVKQETQQQTTTITATTTTTTSPNLVVATKEAEVKIEVKDEEEEEEEEEMSRDTPPPLAAALSSPVAAAAASKRNHRQRIQQQLLQMNSLLVSVQEREELRSRPEVMGWQLHTHTPSIELARALFLQHWPTASSDKVGEAFFFQPDKRTRFAEAQNRAMKMLPGAPNLYVRATGFGKSTHLFSGDRFTGTGPTSAFVKKVPEQIFHRYEIQNFEGELYKLYNPLLAAITINSVEWVTAFLDAGVPTDLPHRQRLATLVGDAAGLFVDLQTPLMWAVKLGCTDIVALLVDKYGCDVTAHSTSLETAMTLALELPEEFSDKRKIVTVLAGGLLEQALNGGTSAPRDLEKRNRTFEEKIRCVAKAFLPAEGPTSSSADAAAEDDEQQQQQQEGLFVSDFFAVVREFLATCNGLGSYVPMTSKIENIIDLALKVVTAQAHANEGGCGDDEDEDGDDDDECDNSSAAKRRKKLAKCCLRVAASLAYASSVIARVIHNYHYKDQDRMEQLWLRPLGELCEPAGVSTLILEAAWHVAEFGQQQGRRRRQEEGQEEGSSSRKTMTIDDLTSRMNACIQRVPDAFRLKCGDKKSFGFVVESPGRGFSFVLDLNLLSCYNTSSSSDVEDDRSRGCHLGFGGFGAESFGALKQEFREACVFCHINELKTEVQKYTMYGKTRDSSQRMKLGQFFTYNLKSGDRGWQATQIDERRGDPCIWENPILMIEQTATGDAATSAAASTAATAAQLRKVAFTVKGWMAIHSFNSGRGHPFFRHPISTRTSLFPYVKVSGCNFTSAPTNHHFSSKPTKNNVCSGVCLRGHIYTSLRILRSAIGFEPAAASESPRSLWFADSFYDWDLVGTNGGEERVCIYDRRLKCVWDDTSEEEFNEQYKTREDCEEFAKRMIGEDEVIAWHVGASRLEHVVAFVRALEATSGFRVAMTDENCSYSLEEALKSMSKKKLAVSEE